MPAFWTSTTFTSIIRQAVAVAKHVPRVSSAGAALAGRRGRQAIVQLAKETFPVLTESSGHLVHGRSAAYALEPIRLGTRHHRPMSAHARLMASGRNIRTGSGGFRAGPRVASNVGLGSARTFASGPSASAAQSNVPVVLRAFASLLSDEEVDKTLPRATRYTPYKPRRSGVRRVRRARSIRSVCSVATVDSRLSISDLTHYFPYTQPTISTPLPPTAETLVTPGSATILSLPLSPSLSALLSSTTEVPYAAAEVGVAVLSSLTVGVISLQEAFSLHYWHKIGPLLARLDDLGFLTSNGAVKGVRHEMVLDGMGRPDILRLTFEGRSEADVMALLGGWLVEEGGRTWWGLREITEVHTKGQMELSTGESTEMMEVWDEPSPHADTPQVGLIFPSLDASIIPSTPPVDSTPDQWASGQSTPVSIYTPISDFDLESELPSPDPHSLTASLLSQLSSVPSVDSQRWSVQPTEGDSDVESAEMYSTGGSEVWAWSSDGGEDEV